MLPDFLIIGAMKSGTTSLYHYLSLHPQIGMSRLKETNFFLKKKNNKKGIDWYQSLFQGDFLIYGEASPNYSKAHYFGGVPQAIHKLLPEVKLIYLVRDPVERIVSHYTHNYARGKEPLNMAKALQDEQKFNEYLVCSKYYWQLQQYLDYFPREQILIISSSKLKSDRKSTLKKIFSFLGVDNTFYSDKYDEEFGTSANMRKKGKIVRRIFESYIMNTLRIYIPNKVKYEIKKICLPSVKKKPNMTSDLRNKFKEHLVKDVRALRDYTRNPFSEWDI